MVIGIKVNGFELVISSDKILFIYTKDFLFCHNYLTLVAVVSPDLTWTKAVYYNILMDTFNISPDE